MPDLKISELPVADPLADADLFPVVQDGETRKALMTALAGYLSGGSVILAGGTVPFTGDQSMGSHKLTSVSDPVSAQDAATKAYVDAIASGLDPKASVRAATTANITLSGAQTIDGVSVIAGDRVLVKDQSTGANNGIYVCASGSWTRATDADASAEVAAGLFCFVSEGTANGDKAYILTTNDPITLGSTALVFALFSSGTSGSAGGDLTGTYPNPTLATSGVSAATYGTAAKVAQVTFDAKGRATTAVEVDIAQVKLTEAPSNQAYTGVIVSLTYGESLTPGAAVYFKSDGTVMKADANGAATYPCIGVALETASSGSHLVLLCGIYRDDSLFAWTVGGLIYLSTTAGGLTQTQPSATDDVVQIVGLATHADRMFVNPQFNYATHV